MNTFAFPTLVADNLKELAPLQTVSDGLLRGTAKNVWKVERALENTGVAFIDESNELGPGVRLTRQEKG